MLDRNTSTVFQIDAAISVDELPPHLQCSLLLAVAIAASQKRNSQSYRVVSIFARSRVDEIISKEGLFPEVDTTSMTIILLMCLYEMVDPARGLIWSLLGLGFGVFHHLRASNKRNIPDTEREEVRRLCSTFYAVECTISAVYGRSSIIASVYSCDASVFRHTWTFEDAQRHERLLRLMDSNSLCPLSLALEESIESIRLMEPKRADRSHLALFPLLYHTCYICESQARPWKNQILVSAKKIIDRHTSQPGSIFSTWLSTDLIFKAGIAILTFDNTSEYIYRAIVLLSGFTQHWDSANAYLKILVDLVK